MPLSGAPIISPRTSFDVCSRLAELSEPYIIPVLAHAPTLTQAIKSRLNFIGSAAFWWCWLAKRKGSGELT